jgi:hypothetical protein
MADEYGQPTPLHRACEDRASTLQDIQRLIEENPQALANTDSLGNTPLLLACYFQNQSPAILQVLLDRSPTQVLGMRNRFFGYTPLHLALHAVDINILRQMIHLYPKALRMLTTDGYTPLYGACRSNVASLELLELLVLHCPEACLILNNDNQSPYDKVVDWRSNELDVVALLQAATINALVAFLVCVHQTLVTLTPAVMTHVRHVLPGLFGENLSVSYYMNGNEAIRQALANHNTLKTLLQNDELQTLLREDEDCQDLIRGIHFMVQAGSNHHVCIMESVSDAPDFMYLHLRCNPSLCVRSASGIAQRQVLSTTEQDTEALAVNNATQTESDRDDDNDNARPTRKRKAPDYLRY